MNRACLLALLLAHALGACSGAATPAASPPPPPNQPPRFWDMDSQTAMVGELLTLGVKATDPDPGDVVTYSMRGSELPGVMFNTRTGVLGWRPVEALAGRSFRVQFVATDRRGAEGTLNVLFAVRSAELSPPAEGEGENRPPVIQPLADRVVHVGELVRVRLLVEDPDPRTRLRVSLAGRIPLGAEFDPATSVFFWIPTEAQEGQTYDLIFRVSDGEIQVSEALRLVVEKERDEPLPSCQPDAEEPEEEPRALVTNLRSEERSICPLGDEDSFAFFLRRGQPFELALDFSHDEGDLDLLVVGPRVFRRYAASTTDNERLLAHADVSGEYRAVVLSVADTNPSYTLRLSVGEPCVDDDVDSGEGNDDASRAAELRRYLDLDLMLCAGDPDFYLVDLRQADEVQISARFIHLDGDLDLQLRGPGGLFYASASASNDETLFLGPVPASGAYLLAVFGAQPGVQAGYRLELREEEPVLSCDEEEFACANGEECVPFAYYCDDDNDCSDLSDERGCPFGCTALEFTCVADDRCIPRGYLCDGDDDCLDGSDEVDCPLICGEEEIPCATGEQCMPAGLRCDGEDDCEDGSDERGCEELSHCDPAYPDLCVPPPPPDLNCGDIGVRGFRVLAPDPHGFDQDYDGVGCEQE